MIIQLTNIASGVAIVANKKLAITPENRKTIGIIELGLGLLALVMRLGVPLPIPALGATFPQAIVAILIGLLLAEQFFDQYPSIRSFINSLKPYEFWLGAVGIFVGLLSLL